MNSSLSEVSQNLHTGAWTLLKYAYVGFNSLFGEGVESRSPLLHEKSEKLETQ